VFEPSNGATGHDTDVSAEDLFFVLGPWAAGTILVDVRFVVSSAGVAGGHAFSMGAVVGASKDANVAAFNAGSGIVQRSDVRIGEKLVVQVRFDATGGTRSITLPIGVEVQRGGLYVIVGYATDDGDGKTDFTASVSTVRRVRIGQGGGGNSKSE